MTAAIEDNSDSKTNPQKNRISLRLPGYDYSLSGAYYVTICVNQHECVFGEIVEEAVRLNPAGSMVRRCWLSLPGKFPSLKIDEFVVMPNHIHGVIMKEDNARHEGVELSTKMRSSLGKIVQWFKTMTTNAYIRGVAAYDWPAFDRRLWQRGYYEHIVRNDVDLRRIREYIVNNPIRWSIEKYHPSRISIEP